MLSIQEQAERAMFISPRTRNRLRLQEDRLVTDDGSEHYKVAGGRVFFIEAHTDSSMADSYDQFDSRLAKLRRAILAKLPYLIRAREADRASAEFARLTQNSFVLGVGGGPVRDYGAVNLNIAPWRNVEIVADAHSLPYADASVDHISCVAVLEHLARPDIVMQEMARVLKPGGLIYLETPGLQPYHGYPYHFQNFTLTGHDLLCERFGLERISSGAAIGPTSALVVLGAEYLRLYLPGGRILSKAFRMTFGLLLAQLDRLVANHKAAYVLAGSSYYLGRKPKPATAS